MPEYVNLNCPPLDEKSMNKRKKRVDKRGWKTRKSLKEIAETTSIIVARTTAEEISKQIMEKAAEQAAAEAAQKLDSALLTAIQVIHEEAEKAIQNIRDQIERLEAAKKARRKKKAEEPRLVTPAKSQKEIEVENYLRSVGVKIPRK